MSDLTIDQLVLDRNHYAADRPAERTRMVALRRSRRVQLGEHLAVEFENLDTLRYQVQEMVYVEGITDHAAAAEEIETYRRLLPSERVLTATMFLEFENQDTVRQDLDGLTGIQHLIELQIGDSSILASDVPPPDEGNDKQTYSVHFLRFELSDDQRTAAADPAVALRLAVNHPKYQASVDIADVTRSQLLVDLGLR